MTNTKASVRNALSRIESGMMSSSDDADIELIHRAAEDPRIRCFIQDLCPALRPYEREGREHHNPRVQALRKLLWPGKLHVLEKVLAEPKLPGLKQIMWRRSIGYVKSSARFSRRAEREVFNALGKLDNLADRRTGLQLDTETELTRQESNAASGVQDLLRAIFIPLLSMQTRRFQEVRDVEVFEPIGNVISESSEAMEEFMRCLLGKNVSPETDPVVPSGKNDIHMSRDSHILPTDVLTTPEKIDKAKVDTPLVVEGRKRKRSVTDDTSVNSKKWVSGLENNEV